MCIDWIANSLRACGPTGKRALIPGSLPTNHVLQKSVETPKTPARKPPQVSRPPPPAPDLVAYYNFEEIRQDTLQLAAPWCLLENSKEQIQVGITEASQVKLRVVILPDFTVQVHVYGFHASSALSTIEHVRLNQFLLDLHERKLCPGITEAGLQMYADLPSGDNHVYFKHVLGYCLDNSGVSCVSCVRSGSCTFVLNNVSSNMCVQCNAAKNLLMKKQQRASESALRPINKHDPLHSTDTKSEIVCSVKNLEVDNSLHNSLKDVVSKTPLETFWEEQQKAFSRKGHGMIRLAILLHSRSPAVYETLRQTGILKLPGESTLRDYTNVFGPKDGFNKQAVDELVRQSKELKEEERFVVLYVQDADSADI
ncbi:uncharacterized protein [Littorina saxatilis]|uniref:uncharacterized protein n=1 Tax=Littorina saxatilis TaxID=31220 RepID=UPI0038B54A38